MYFWVLCGLANDLFCLVWAVKCIWLIKDFYKYIYYQDIPELIKYHLNWNVKSLWHFNFVWNVKKNILILYRSMMDPSPPHISKTILLDEDIPYWINMIQGLHILDPIWSYISSIIFLNEIWSYELDWK